jgi:hypothetical protein
MKKLVLTPFLLLLLSFVSLAQTEPQASPPRPAASATQPTPSPSPAAIADVEDAPPHKLSSEEAKDLLASVDEVLRFASGDTDLPIKHSVKKAIVSREQVEKYLNDKMESDVDRIRFERSELVLKKFGLLPREFNLHTFLIKLLAEQVAGYYDEKTKTMNLLDWNESEMQKPVMAHELTHALQDQSYDLAKMSKHDEEIEKRGLEDLEALIRNDEESTCRTAVLEGQAMIVLLDYVLAPAGRSVAKTPGLVDFFVDQSTREKSKDSPIFESAPLLLQDELIFPYRQGMVFIKELLVSGGKKKAYADVLARLPRTTREIMEPKEYLAGHREPPLLLPDLGFLKKDYEGYDAGVIGQLDVDILLKVYADPTVADRLNHEWRGGAYYAAGRRGAKPQDKNSSAHVGLFYISKWSTPAAAREFAVIYAAALPQRYTGLKRVAPDPPRPGLESFESSDGPIYIQQTGNAVVAVESFDPDIARRLIEAGLKQANVSSGSTNSASK